MASATDKLKWHRVYQFHVGGVPLVFGSTEGGGTTGPVIYSAAFNEKELRGEMQAGFGATEAEAAADLFRSVRDGRPFGF